MLIGDLTRFQTGQYLTLRHQMMENQEIRHCRLMSEQANNGILDILKNPKGYWKKLMECDELIGKIQRVKTQDIHLLRIYTQHGHEFSLNVDLSDDSRWVYFCLLREKFKTFAPACLHFTPVRGGDLLEIHYNDTILISDQTTTEIRNGIRTSQKRNETFKAQFSLVSKYMKENTTITINMEENDLKRLDLPT